MPALIGKRVLVTGGAGFIGSHLVDRIIQEDPASVVVVDNLFLGKEANLDEARQVFPALTFYREDASEYDTMEQIVGDEQIDVVFNLAVVPLPLSLENPRYAMNTNTAITTTFCELLRLKRYETLIHFSSSEAYGSCTYMPMDEHHPYNASTPYATSKLACDYLVLSYHHTFGIDAGIVRPFNNYGPRQNEGSYAGIIPIVVHRIMRGEPIVIYGDGEQTRDFVFVRDVAEGAVRLYEEPASRGLVVNLASGRERSINYLVRTIMELMGTEVPVVHDPPRLGDVRRHCGNIGLAYSLIGFQPRISYREGLLETINWYREAVKE